MKLKQQLTVRQLIDVLNKLPKDSLIWQSPCSCVGAITGAKKDGKGSVALTRMPTAEEASASHAWDHTLRFST